MARTDGAWDIIDGQYLEPNESDLGVLLNGSNLYLNFGSAYGSGGYGLRDNGGTLQFKNSGGSWADLGSGGGVSDGDKGDITVSGSGTVWTIDNDTIGLDELSASGTPSSSTFLRGDNTWADPSVSANNLAIAYAVALG